MNYKSLLYEIQNASVQGPTVDTIIVPSNILLYNVNLDTREIEAPEYLSVQHEHAAETVYFLVDRYYDNMDLAQTTCVVQYVTPDDEGYIYAVPFCDTITFSGGIKDEDGKIIDEQPKIIIPWCISGSATKLSGTVKYVLRFYKIDEASVVGENNEYDPSKAEFSYSLSTKPASSKVMHGLPIDGILDEQNYHIETNNRFYEFLNIINQMVDNATIYWIDA